MKARTISTASSTVPENRLNPSVPAASRKGLRYLMAKALREPGKIPRAAWTEMRTLAVLARHGFPDVLLQFLGGIGDELLLTAVAHELKKRDPSQSIWQVSHSPAVLEGNADYDRIFNWGHLYLRYSNLLNRRRLELRYSEFSIPGEAEIPPQRHIIAELCFRAGVRGEISIRPYLYLSPDEEARGRLADHQVVVHCVGENSYETYMANKAWPRTRYEELVSAMKESRILPPGCKIVQVGTPRDPPLKGAMDLRGRTTLRETAAILKNAEAFVGGSGLLSHMARAVDCRAVIIYGGREHSHQTGYICNENLDSFVDCAPCWRWNTCDFERKCLTMITPDRVLGALDRVLAKRGQPLEVETVEL